MARISQALIAILLLGTSGVLAACPPAVSSTTAEAIRANQARVLCLQQELAADTGRRKLDFDILTLERSVQDMQLKQRLNAVEGAVPPPAIFR